MNSSLGYHIFPLLTKIPHVEINGTIIKYENKEKHQDFKWKPLWEETMGREESFTMTISDLSLSK